MKEQLQKNDTSVSSATPKEEAQSAATGVTAIAAAKSLDAARERRPLESYFHEIGGTRTLRREEEVILAKELQSATLKLREALYALPSSARFVVERWDELRAMSHTGAKISESAADEETGDIAKRLERVVGNLRKHLEMRALLFAESSAESAEEIEKLDKKILRQMHRAQLSLTILSELRDDRLRQGPGNSQ